MKGPSDHLVYTRVGVRGFLSATVTRTPDYSIGDLRYLRPNQAHPRQLRPLVSADMLPAVQYDAGMRMIVFKLPGGKGKLRPVVKLPSELRENTPANADAAWRLVLADVPELVDLYGDIVRLPPERPAG